MKKTLGEKLIIGIDEVGRAASKRRASPNTYIIGIDEVGRGALAGPVVVAALILPKDLRYFPKKLGKLKDSKRLTAKKRLKWLAYIDAKPQIQYALARVYPKVIDKINISQAANRAVFQALTRLLREKSLRVRKLNVYLDGGLYLTKNLKLITYNCRTIIRGDEKINAVKLASIAAKVKRDQYMIKLHCRHPQYGFDKHKGYGTKKHINAIKRLGLAKIHRLTFLRKYVNMN